MVRFLVVISDVFWFVFGWVTGSGFGWTFGLVFYCIFGWGLSCQVFEKIYQTLLKTFILENFENVCKVLSRFWIFLLSFQK